MPFRGSVEPLLGGQLIEAVALSLESELLSSLGQPGGAHQAELWPGLAVGLPTVSPWCHRSKQTGLVLKEQSLSPSWGRGLLPPGDFFLLAFKA